MKIHITRANYLLSVYSLIRALGSWSIAGSFMRLLLIAWVTCCAWSGTATAKERYSPNNISVAADRFLARVEQPIINVEFIVVHTVNGAFHALRQGREVGEDAVEGGNAGSVVIGPGTDFGDLIIINENEGDSIVINK